MSLIDSTDSGISNYIAQAEKFGAGASDGPIYSTIDPTSDELRTFNGVFSQHTTPYATTPVVPYGAQSLPSPSEERHWDAQPSTSSIQYSQPEWSRVENGRNPCDGKHLNQRAMEMPGPASHLSLCPSVMGLSWPWWH